MKGWRRVARVGFAVWMLSACGDDEPSSNGPPADATTPDSSPSSDAGAPDSSPDTGALDRPPVSERGSIASGDAVFFVGNSFFMTGDRVLPEWVAAVGDAVDPKVEIQTGANIVPGNQRLSWFLAQSASQKALQSRRYRVFVLQPEEREPVDEAGTFKQAVRDWNEAITAAGGKTMLFMTWDLERGQGTDFLNKLVSSFDEISEELNIPVIPAGQIYDDCYRDPFPGVDPDSVWVTQEDLHQNEVGSAINAYATFGMLTGIDVRGVVFDATNNTNSPAMMTYLAEHAWTRVDMRLPPAE